MIGNRRRERIRAAQARVNQEQRDLDALLQRVLSEFVASSQRIAAKLHAKADEDPTWGDLADYHDESLRSLGVSQEGPQP